MIGKNFASIIHKDDKQKWFDFLSKIKLGKRQQNINYRVLHQEGHYVWHSSTIILIEKITKALHRKLFRHY
jgi:hypothetical protein